MREVSKETVRNRLFLLNRGHCYINNGYIVFKVLGNYYSSNLKRNKMYNMDDRYWFRFYLPLLTKLYLIISKQVRRVK